MTDTRPVAPKHSVWTRLYNGETDVQFIPRWKLWFAISAAVIVVGVLGLLGRGLNLGIEFDGGVAWEVPAGHGSVNDVRDAVTTAGLTEPTVQSLGSSQGTLIRVQAEKVSKADQAKVVDAIVRMTGSKASSISFSEVGPSWGKEISKKARDALIFFLVAVSIYIAVRFEWKMALATLIALLHDILITVGVYAVVGFPVTPATVIAFLTILGYSIYDGIVVFDRVDENAKVLGKTGATTYSDMVNRSMNEVLMRSLNTSITALLPIASLLFVGSFILGATSLQEFALALFIGLLSGAYSSIFIASPALALLKEREERWATLRRRLERGAGAAAATAPAPSSRPTAQTDDDGPMVTTRQAIQARARKQRRRR
ncbi:MAG: protein translocase subunit SecF [Acidobacteria bacterium]|nr:protein translocase subunit SecF [Acidobacteriota bacterium]